jgi:hypothetical protein
MAVRITADFRLYDEILVITFAAIVTFAAMQHFHAVFKCGTAVGSHDVRFAMRHCKTIPVNCFRW